MEYAETKSYGSAINLKKSSAVSGANDWAQSLSTALIFVVLIFSCIFRMVMVDGHSMDPTLNDTDRLIISSLFANPQNDDIVVVLTEGNNGHPIIKRVIGTEYQTVKIDYANDTVTVTDKDGSSVTLNEPYINEQDMYIRGDVQFAVSEESPVFTYNEQTGETETVTYTVPKGRYFVMGDNRNNSKDSRYADIGFVSRSQILGEVVLRVLPFNLFGVVE